MRSRARYLPLALIPVFAYHFGVRPSNDRDWTPDQRVLPKVSIDGNVVRVENVRRAAYRSPADFDVAYRAGTFDADKLVRVWYMVEKFAEWEGMAHTLLCFELEGPEFVSVSVEIRKEAGESYSVLKGLFRRYELMYVIADEEDVIGLRAIHRKHDVYLYPVRAPKEAVRALFLDMMRRARTLEAEPEFYNSVTNTCTTNIVAHVRKIAPNSVPRSLKVLMPGYSDRLAYDLGLIGDSRPFEEIQRLHLISPRAREFKGGSFSSRIRSRGPSP